MKTTTQKFECDECHKTIEITQGEKAYPYNEKWVYLYKLEWKYSAIIPPDTIGDNHFCGVICMTEYLKKHLADKMFGTKK